MKLKISVYILLCVAILGIRDIYGMKDMPESEFLLKKRSPHYEAVPNDDSGNSAHSLPSADIKNVLYDDRYAFRNLYKRVRIDDIQRTKRNKIMFESRLKNFIKKTKQNIMFGEWNDRGRLLKY